MSFISPIQQISNRRHRPFSKRNICVLRKVFFLSKFSTNWKSFFPSVQSLIYKLSFFGIYYVHGTMLITCFQDLEDLWSLNMLSVMNHRSNDEFLIENWTRAYKKRIFLAFYLLKTLFKWNEMKRAFLCQFFVQIFLKKKGETYRKKVDFPKSQLVDKSHALSFEKKS